MSLDESGEKGKLGGGRWFIEGRELDCPVLSWLLGSSTPARRSVA